MVRRWVPALALGGLWWWAVLRLALQPEQAGLVEGAVAAGGWGLSLLPVHVAGGGSAGGSGADSGSGPAEGSGSGVERGSGSGSGVGSGPASAWRASSGAVEAVTGWLRAISGPGRERQQGCGRWGAGVTRAWRRRRSGGGSGRS